MDFLRGVLWIAAGRWVHNLLNLVSFAVIISQVDPAAYGAYALAMTILILAEVYATDVTEHAIVRHKGPDGEADLVGRLVAGIGILAIGGGAIVAGTIVGAIGFELLSQLLWAMAGVAVLQAGTSLGRGRLLRAGRMRAFAATISAANLVGVAVALMAVAAGWGVWSLVCQQAAIHVVAITLSQASLPRVAPARLAEPREHLRFALYGLGAAVLNVGSNRVDVLLAAAYLGQAGAGIFGLAKRLIQILQDLISSAFDKALVSFLSHRAGFASETYSIAVLAQALLVLPAFAGFAILADDLVPGLFGVEWTEAAALIPVMALGGVFRSTVAIDRAQQIFDGQIGRIVVVRLAEFALSLLILWPLAPLGLVWIGVGFSLRYLASYLLVLRSRFQSFDEMRGQIAATATALSAPFAATAIMVMALWMLEAIIGKAGLGFALFEVVLGAAIYIVFLWQQRQRWLPTLLGRRP